VRDTSIVIRRLGSGHVVRGAQHVREAALAVTVRSTASCADRVKLGAHDDRMAGVSEVICLMAGEHADGSPVMEEVLVEPLEGGRYRLLRSPGLVLGLAAGDVLEVGAGGAFEVLSRAGNLCIQVYVPREGIEEIESAARHEMESLDGRLDGKASGQLVFTVHVSAGFVPVEEALRRLTSRFHDVEWYYGNVYEPHDGVTPMNWWKANPARQ
jgi:Domain of unknown function (DUF4265)